MQAMNPIATLAQRLAAKTPGAKALGPQTPAAPLRLTAGSVHAPETKVHAKLHTKLHAADQIAQDLKKRLTRKALFGSSAALIPLPLIDLAVDVALLSNMLNEIHTAFGLSPAQLAALDTGKRHRMFAAIQWVGNRAIGQLLTAAVVKRLISGMGVKLTAGQLSKVVPIAGQLASAALNFATLRHIVHAHIDDCVRVLKHANAATDTAAVVAEIS